MKEVFVPALGMAMEECILVEWLKQPGDEVTKGEALAVIETDKATMDLESPGEGRLGPHLFDAGTTIPVGTIVVHVLEGDEEGDIVPAQSSATARPPEPSSTAEHGTAAAVGGTVADSGESQGDYRTPHQLSPRQRRLKAAEPVKDALVTDKSLTGSDDRHRAAVAGAVSESWRTIPHFSVTSQIWAETLLSSVQQARQKVPTVTVTDLLLRAFAHALYETGASGDGSIGLAVATERGVVIPVIADVGRLALPEVAASRVEALARAREGRMSAVDGRTPKFSLSNLGIHDVEYFTGIIPVGQSGLLTIGRAKARPVVADGMLAIVTTVYATLNVDHRSFDGVHAGAILDAFSRILNDPGRLIA